MKTLIIVSSTYLGNTMKVANAIAKELNATVQTPEKTSSSDLKKYDLIGFGSGINFAAHNKNILRFVETSCIENKKVFIFSTRCRPTLGKYHSKLKTLIKNQGGILLGEFSCGGFDRTGPWVGMNGYNKNRPNSRDLFKASIFANDIRKKAHPLSLFKKDYPIIDQYKGLDMRENKVVGDIVLLDTISCISCGKCAENCPLNVFLVEKENEKKVIPIGQKNCIMCGTCEKGCPVDAIYINETFLNGVRIMFREVLSDELQTAYWSK